MKNNIKNSILLKTLCYILIPIFVILILVNILYMIFLYENNDIKQAESFEQTNMFSSQYLAAIENTLNKIGAQKYYFTQYLKYEDNVYVENSYYRNSDFIKFVIIDNEKNAIYTNLDLYDYSINVLKEAILDNNSKYCNYNCQTKKFTTNIDNSRIQKIEISYLENELLENSSFEIYTIVNDEGNKYNLENELFEFANNLKNIPIILLPILILLVIVMVIYLILSLGHKKDCEGIYLNPIEKWPFEISCIISLCGIIFGIIVIDRLGIDYLSYDEFEMALIFIIEILAFVLIYSMLAMIATIFVKKLKSHTFIKSSLLYKIVKWTKKVFKNLFKNLNNTIKVIIIFLGIIFLHVVLVLLELWFLIPIIWLILLYYMIKAIDDFSKIKQALKNIYEGKNDKMLNEEEFRGELKEVSKYVNDIQSGFSNAIEKSLKSERMKTELITNVSHDIKTPLTSIINYVDLLKKEEIQNEKAKEYIDVLDGKSQRLKKLIEDLVEASKASSGNIKLNIEKINLVELIKQTMGEFEDKFNKKGLHVELKNSDENICINADNRYMYRIIENVFSNISKYALENSRVYIDVNKKDDKSIIEIKNISKEKLNISAEELMQRFVRGDKSRTTEGSGLRIINFAKFNRITKWKIQYNNRWRFIQS